MTELKLQGYVTPPYPCSYLPQRQARSRVAVLQPNQVQQHYDRLIQSGFRRSGEFIYAPHCDACTACVSMRVPVAEFSPTRSQKRAAAALATMQLTRLPLQFSQEHLELYLRYQRARHEDSAQTKEAKDASISSDDRLAFEQFLLRSPMHSELIELRDENASLLAVSVVDWVANGVSAVYTFYEPSARGSLGTTAIMAMMQLAQQAGLPYVYLGYWIEESLKMSYKSRFQPAQLLRAEGWQPF